MELRYPVSLKVKEFHQKFDIHIGSFPSIPEHKEVLLRLRLISEEFAELVEAIGNNTITHVAKELADLLYVTYGTAISFGIPIDDILHEVHKSNMTKTKEKDSGGKIQKGPGYVPPDLLPALLGGTVK
jgi:predicted HAD superfamily Cof-like phosphohydrolase